MNKIGIAPPENPLCDFLGNQLRIGDEVVYIGTNSRDLERGEVIQINPKTVIIGRTTVSTLRGDLRWEDKKDPMKVVRIL